MGEQDMMITFLKHLHYLLLKLSSYVSAHHVLENATSMVVSSRSFIDLIDLSNLLYRKLQDQQILLYRSFNPPVEAASEKDCPTLDIEISREGFVLLLRCCMSMLHFLQFDLSLVMEKCQTLLVFLGKLCPHCSSSSHSLKADTRISNFENPDAKECSYNLVCTNHKAGLQTSFLCATLEVFIDEFLVHQQLREHFMMADYVSDKPEKLFLSHADLGRPTAVLELISSHFLHVFCDESTFNRYIHSLFWSKMFVSETPELTLDAASILLGHTIIFTAPPILQAHIFLLVSRCIGIQMPTDDRKLEVHMFDCYMSAFERSVSLYAGYIPTLEIIEYPKDDELHSKLYFEGPSFGSCIRPVTREKLNLQTEKLVAFCCAHSHGGHYSSNSEILNKFAGYVTENQYVIDEPCRDEACSVLNSILSRMISSEIFKGILHQKGEDFQQEVCSIAALMKIMSSSLLQIIWFLKKSRTLDITTTLKDNILCREYAFLSQVMSSFGRYRVNQHIQETLLKMMETSSGKHSASQLMLLHFISLLLYSFNMRLEFLWKGCTFMLMVIINFLHFEEGNLDVFRPYLPSRKEDLTSQFSPSRTSQKRSVIIASNIQNTQMIYLRDPIEDFSAEGQCVDTRNNDTMGAENTENNEPCTTGVGVCNGLAYVECLPDYHHNPSDWEDLLDFIECKNGKDYSNWLKNRKRYRKWQHDRITSSKQQRKKRRSWKESRKKSGQH